ncbi:hypothetical protein [Stenotrophomonas lactitubi]|uniref:hypothetical protein n=1 Tax=Stenotrophomonas lactitubi TaxID=2045214 RepID=UPI0028A16047|nr:hypothetical protein [Stenotrophomonas lactitubi]
MIKRSKAEVEQLLWPYFDVMVRVITEAWDRWSKSEERQRWLFDRERANYIFGHIAANAVEMFDDRPSVQIVRKDETLLFIVDRVLVFRFKKADAGYISRNVPTQQALAYHADEEALFDDLDRVEVVYRINDLGTAIKDICVVARAENRVLWTIPLQAAASDNVVTLAPAPGGEGPQGPAAPRAKPKLFVVKGEGLHKKNDTGDST